MKKELNYLSLPDHFNKFLLTNINQKLNYNKTVFLNFRLSSILHLGSALKAIYLLETIFPRKVSVLKIVLKKKKLYFGQKSKDTIFFTFTLNLFIFEFIELFRFFLKKPLNLNKKKIEESIFINRKLKQFDFNNNLYVDFKNSGSSFFFLNLYHC